MKRKAFKQLIYSGLPVFLLLLQVWPAAANATDPTPAAKPDREYSKTISREFSTSAEGTTALYNRYGKVNVNTWTKNAVKIDITITVNAANQQAADRVFENINVNFTNTHGYVKAETVIGDMSKGIWNSGSQDFRINYEVYMPIGNQLDLKNKYGNSYVGNLNGKLLAEIKYGDLRTETIRNDAELSLGYGKASMASVNNLFGQVSYGGVNLVEARDVQLDSKYSELKMEKVTNLRMTSKYDDFSLGAIEDIRLQTKYADVKVQNARAALITAQYTNVRLASLADYLDVDLTYGDLRVAQIEQGFKEVKVNSKYTNVELQMAPGAAYRFEAEGTHTGMRVPPSGQIRRMEESGGRKVLNGHIGDAGAKGVIRVRMAYGDLNLK